MITVTIQQGSTYQFSIDASNVSVIRNFDSLVYIDILLGINTDMCLLFTNLIDIYKPVNLDINDGQYHHTLNGANIEKVDFSLTHIDIRFVDYEYNLRRITIADIRKEKLLSLFGHSK